MQSGKTPCIPVRILVGIPLSTMVYIGELLFVFVFSCSQKNGVSLPACSSLLYTCVPLPPFPHGISTDFSFTEMGMFVSISCSQAAAQPPTLKTRLRGCRLSHIQQAKICVQGTSRGDCHWRRHAIFIVRRSGTRRFAYTCACSGGGGSLPWRERRHPQIY